MTGKAYLKSMLLFVLLVASSIFFGWVCRQMQAKYDAVLQFEKSALWLLLWMAVSAILVIMFTGLVAAFVRSQWLSVVYVVISTACILFTWGFSLVAFSACVLYAVLGVVFVLAVARHRQNQVRFSISSMTSRQTLVQTGLIVLIAAAFVVGIQNDVRTNQSVLPVEIKDSVLTLVMPIMQSKLQDMGITGATSESISGMAQSTLDLAWAQIEQSLKPLAAIIPYIAGTLIFGLVEIVFLVISWLPGVIELIFIGLLKAMGFLREEKQMREVIELTL
jgi:hypothetical protein